MRNLHELRQMFGESKTNLSPFQDHHTLQNKYAQKSLINEIINK